MERPKIVLHIGRALGTVAGASLCHQAKFLARDYGATHDFVLIIAGAYGPEGSKKVEEIIGIRFSEVIACRGEWFNTVRAGTYPTWMDFIDQADWFGHLTNVDKIYVIGGMISSMVNRKTTKLNDALDMRSFMGITAIGTYISVFLQLIKFSNANVIELNEICYDPDEFAIGLFTDERIKAKYYNIYFAYDIPAYSIQRLDYAQDDFREYDDTQDRTNGFIFGAGFTAKSRYAIYDDVRDVLTEIEKEFPSFIYITNNKLKLKTQIPYSLYLDKLAYSSFTLIIPSYDINTFSILRFMEAIASGCIPMILSTVYLDDFVASFNIDTKFLDKLIVTKENVLSKMRIAESERTSILTYFKEALITNPQ